MTTPLIITLIVIVALWHILKPERRKPVTTNVHATPEYCKLVADDYTYRIQFPAHRRKIRNAMNAHRVHGDIPDNIDDLVKLVHFYFQDEVNRANALEDIHPGAAHYAKSKKL